MHATTRKIRATTTNATAANPTMNPAEGFALRPGFCICTAAGKLPFAADDGTGGEKDDGNGGEDEDDDVGVCGESIIGGGDVIEELLDNGDGVTTDTGGGEGVFNGI